MSYNANLRFKHIPGMSEFEQKHTYKTQTGAKVYQHMTKQKKSLRTHLNANYRK